MMSTNINETLNRLKLVSETKVPIFVDIKQKKTVSSFLKALESEPYVAIIKNFKNSCTDSP